MIYLGYALQEENIKTNDFAKDVDIDFNRLKKIIENKVKPSSNEIFRMVECLDRREEYLFSPYVPGGGFHSQKGCKRNGKCY